MKVQFAPIEVNHAQLQIQSQNIALEALSVNLPHRQLLSKLSTLVSDTTSFISKKLSKVAMGISQGRRESLLSFRFSNKLSKIPYTELVEIRLPTPEGLKVSYLEYVSFLEEAQAVTVRLYDDFLHPFASWIASMVEKPESVESIANHAKEFDFQRFDEIEAKFTNYISGISAYQPYGSVIKANRDWDEIEDALKRMVDLDRRQPRELVSKKVSDINSLLGVLMQKMANPNLSYRPTPKVIQDLSELTFKLAEHVTFYSVMEAALDSMIVAINDAKTEVIKEIKRR